MLEVTMVFWGREQSMPHRKWLEASTHWQVDPATSSRSLSVTMKSAWGWGQRLRGWREPGMFPNCMVEWGWAGLVHV